MRFSSRRTGLIGAAALVVALLAAAPAVASHSWGSYHWARTSDSFTVTLGKNLGSAWTQSPYLETVSADWSADRDSNLSNPVNTVVAPGATTAKRCTAVTGRVQVCGAGYGRNGWLGLASVWISGSHITKATVKLNDSYFTTATYNTYAWRRSVMCQEVGHTFGLDHQSTNPEFNANTCMDYYKVPNLAPNQHDYDQLTAIYGSHRDTTTTLASTTSSARRGAGLRPVRDDLWVEELGNGVRRIVHVYWVDHGPHLAPHEG
jgi:hypothetical protein